MNAFIIEQKGVIKEAFSYERVLNEGTQKALVEYARATYGPEVALRRMTPEEEAHFRLHGPEFFKNLVRDYDYDDSAIMNR